MMFILICSRTQNFVLDQRLKNKESVGIDGVDIVFTINKNTQSLEIGTIDGQPALKTETEIKSLNIPEKASINQNEYPITAILPYAFAKSKVVKITFECALSRIDNGAFSNCPNLQQIIFSEKDTWTRIPDFSFTNSVMLQSINIGGAKITSVGKSAFENTEIDSFDFSHIISIDACAFKNLHLTELLNLNENIEIIGDEAFKNTMITNIYFNSKIKSIGIAAFMDCQKLETVYLLPSIQITTINASLFFGCYALSTISLPPSIESINDDAFNSAQITTFVGSSNLQYIGNQSFYSTALTYVDLKNTNVDRIGDNAFKFCFQLDTIDLPINLKAIGSFAFQKTLIESFIAPATLNIIEEGAFKQCDSLQILDLRETSVDIIPNQLCYFNTNLKIVHFSNNIKKIGDEAFSSCTYLESIQFPATLESIGIRSFEKCTLLPSVDLSKTIVNSIGEYAFSMCTNNNFLNLSTSTDVIVYQHAFEENAFDSLIFRGSFELKAYFAFGYCPNLNYADLSQVTSDYLPRHLFSHCPKITTIILPTDRQIAIYPYCFEYSGVKEIIGKFSYLGMNSFEECKSLTYVDMRGSIFEYVPTMLFINCDYLEKVIMSNCSSCSKIMPNAFQNCKSLKSIILPENLELIYEYSFMNSGLESIDFTNTNVYYLFNQAFSNCYNLKEVIGFSRISHIYAYVFENCYSLKELRFGPNVVWISSSIMPYAGVELLDWSLIEGVIGWPVFANLRKLKEIVWPAYDFMLGNQTFIGSSIGKTFVLPGNLLELGFQTFAKMDETEFLDMGETKIKRIPTRAFAENTNLETIILPIDLESVSLDAFAESPNIKHVYYQGLKFLSGDPFSECPDVTIYVSKDYQYESIFDRSFTVYDFSIPIERPGIETETESESETESETKAEATSEIEIESESETKAEETSEIKIESETETETKVEATSDIEIESETETYIETEDKEENETSSSIPSQNDDNNDEILDDDDDMDYMEIGPIFGIVFGVLAFIVAIVAVALFMNRKNKPDEETLVSNDGHSMGMIYDVDFPNGQESVFWNDYIVEEN